MNENVKTIPDAVRTSKDFVKKIIIDKKRLCTNKRTRNMNN